MTMSTTKPVLTPNASGANPSALPPASLGVLTDEEQRVYNTVIANGGNGVQSVINLRAQNAGVAALDSGAAKTVHDHPNRPSHYRNQYAGYLQARFKHHEYRNSYSD